jgi:hypothetical protein
MEVYVHAGLGELVTNVDDEGRNREAGNLRGRIEGRESGPNHTEERGHDEGGNIDNEPEMAWLACTVHVDGTRGLTRL